MLSEEVVDPTAMLTQVRLLDFYTPGNFETSAQTNAALIQPIIPIARLSLLPVEQIVRFTFKVSTVATGPGSHPITALADTQMYDLFQSQWPHLERWKLRWAMGRRLSFPLPATTEPAQMHGKRARRQQSRLPVCPIFGLGFCFRIRFPLHTAGPALSLKV